MLDALNVVFSAIEGVWSLFHMLDNAYSIYFTLLGFFVAFTVYRFIVRPFVGGGFVDPTSVLRFFKGADSDEARKPEKK